MKAKPHYGFDAPEIIIKYFTLALIILVIGILFHRYLPHVWWAIAFVVMVYVTAFFFLLPVASIILGSLYFKFRERDWLFDKLALLGNENVLDVGCGRGLLLIGAAKRLTTGKVHGLDLWVQADQARNSSKATLENVRIENVGNKVEIHTGDMRNMPFLDETFDAIISSFVIHNLRNKEDRDKTLMEIKRVLKPGGKIAIMDIEFAPNYINFFYTHGFTEVQLLGPRRTFGINTYLVLGVK